MTATIQAQRSASEVLPRQRDLYYAGDWHAPASGGYFPVNNPATGECLGEVAEAGAKDVDRCVASAKAAFPAWRGTPPSQRAAALRKIAQVVREHADELALLDAIDIAISVALLVVFRRSGD